MTILTFSNGQVFFKEKKNIKIQYDVGFLYFILPPKLTFCRGKRVLEKSIDDKALIFHKNFKGWTPIILVKTKHNEYMYFKGTVYEFFKTSQ